VTRIGYLVPEFPGQTHAFFWREVRALAAMGIEADVLSTRRPEKRIICHDWSREAMGRTTYLFPPGPTAAASAMGRVARRPANLRECMGVGRALELRGAAGQAKLWGLVSMGARLATLSAARGWTHVHVHSCGDAAAVALFANMLGGPSYSLTLHGAVEDYGAGQDAKWGNAAFGFVVSRALLAGLCKAAPHLDETKVSVAPMGVDIAKFTRSRSYRPAGSDERWRIVTCGRLHIGKGHLELVRAVGLLRDQGRRVEARIIGEGDARGAIERLIGELGLGGSVTLLGALPETRVREELEHAHVFALASYTEAIGVATMEAMALELPVVVTGVGGVPELVRHGVDGLLVAPQDAGVLAAALTTVLTDGDLACRLGKSGAERVRESFHSNVSAQRLAAGLERMWARPDKASPAARSA
jgi:glycosyltransferase involved in cell wall biosynthesis